MPATNEKLKTGNSNTYLVEKSLNFVLILESFNESLRTYLFYILEVEFF